MLVWDVDCALADAIYWPYFFLCQRLQTRSIWQDRAHRISMLSGIPRPHRIQLWREIQSCIRPQDVVLINRFSYWSQDTDLGRDLPWSNHPELIETDQERSLSAMSTVSIDHPAYRACVNLPLETLLWTDQVFVTEKTWKSLVAGCLPWHGCAKIPRYLQQLGFKDWFGETQSNALSAGDLFGRDDLWDFYHDHLNEIQAAQERFWSDQLVIQQTQAAMARLENWVRT